MRKSGILERWKGLSPAARDSLWTTIYILAADAPFPADMASGEPAAFEEAVRAGLARRDRHDLWGEACVVDADVRAALSTADVPALQGSALQALLRGACESYCGYFVWPPTEMLESARLWEPHLDGVAREAANHGLWGEAARVLHHRALLVAWRTKSFKQPLRYSSQAVAVFRQADGRNPNPGTLGLLLSGLATWQDATGAPEDARKSVEEALACVGPLVRGKPSIELFLLHCQLGSICAKLKEPAAAERARAEARRLAKGLAAPGAERHVDGTLSWAQWALQRYVGF